MLIAAFCQSGNLIAVDALSVWNERMVETMFDAVELAPVDPILGLTDAFKSDPNPAKINLGVGIYQDAEGRAPILAAVKEAERRGIAAQTTKSYLPITGDPVYGQCVQDLIFGAEHEIISSGRALTAHTPGGTGALRVVGDYLHRVHPGAAIWLSDPTWANHKSVFAAAGLEIKTYPYFDRAANALAFDRFIEALGQVPAGDIVLLHGACHNPTGVDPTAAQWSQVAELLAQRGVVPLVDFAYQGFGAGIAEDAVGLRTLCRPGGELIICSSYSKNFGLYRDRVGALTLVAGNKDAAQRAFSHVKVAIRSNYSNPAGHGAAIVTTILGDAELRIRWQDEVAQMRSRINAMRDLFVETLATKGVKGDYSFIRKQNGMFSFSGLTKDQVNRLRQEHSIYIVGSGRINVAGITASNVDRLCEAIGQVL
jgi:aspartate/tyrosine/aromatic aminotransferase